MLFDPNVRLRERSNVEKDQVPTLQLSESPAHGTGFVGPFQGLKIGSRKVWMRSHASTVSCGLRSGSRRCRIGHTLLRYPGWNWRFCRAVGRVAHSLQLMACSERRCASPGSHILWTWSGCGIFWEFHCRKLSASPTDPRYSPRFVPAGRSARPRSGPYFGSRPLAAFSHFGTTGTRVHLMCFAPAMDPAKSQHLLSLMPFREQLLPASRN